MPLKKPIEEIEQQAGETDRHFTTRRLDREKYWMLELGTVYPYGLNNRLQNVGNVSKASFKHLYVFSLLNRRKRRTRSHVPRYKQIFSCILTNMNLLLKS